MGSLAAQSEVQADADRLSKAGNADVVGLHCGCRLRVPSEATNRTGSARIVKRWFETGGGTLGGRPDKRYWDGWQPSPKYRGMLIVCLQSRKRGCVKQ